MGEEVKVEVTSSIEVASDVIDNVADRLEFFFSDTNLRSDKFMKTEMKYNDGMVAIHKLLRFNSIKKITTDPAHLVKAVEESERVKDILKLSEDKSSIGRVNKFDVSAINDNVPLTLFVKGLPTREIETSAEGEETKNPTTYTVTVSDVKALFQEFGTVTLVRLRFAKKLEKTDPTVALGEAFVEFQTQEMAQRAVAELCATADGEPKKKLTINGAELAVQAMREWIDKKEKNKEGGKNKRRRDNEEEKDTKEERAVPDNGFDIVWQPGCVVSVKGFPNDCDRETIRAAIQEHESFDPKEVYIDFSRGQKVGAIRFDSPSDKVKELAEKLKSGDIRIKGMAVESADVLDGEEEKTYWENFKDFKRKQMKHQAASNSRGGGRPKRGRHSRR